jgi:YfiH family protein
VPVVVFKDDNGAAYCQFELLADCREVRHAIFLRTHGFSEAPYHRLNVSFAVGDEAERVARNRRLVAQALDAEELVFVRQVHGHRALVVGDRSGGDGAALPEADAMLADRAGKFLVVQVADCQPILMHDPVRRVVANVHCGWRGSVADVAGRTVAALQSRFGCAPQDLLVGVGPSLGPCCAEFIHYRSEIPARLWGYRRDSVCFDFWAMTRDQLIAAGVPAGHIQISGLCTRCDPDRFFSYRAHNRTGRFPAVIGLKR